VCFIAGLIVRTGPGLRAKNAVAARLPSVPTPMAAAIHILPPEWVHPVDVPFTVALKVFSKWGAGAG